METTIFDVAIYILEHTSNISIDKLQILCYYCQAWHLVCGGEPFFEEDFLARPTGPDCEQLSPSTIRKFHPRLEILRNGNSSRLSEWQRNLVDTVLADYSHMTIRKLRETVKSEVPWKKAYGQPIGFIEKNWMKDYYSDALRNGIEDLANKCTIDECEV